MPHTFSLPMAKKKKKSTAYSNSLRWADEGDPTNIGEPSSAAAAGSNNDESAARIESPPINDEQTISSDPIFERLHPLPDTGIAQPPDQASRPRSRRVWLPKSSGSDTDSWDYIETDLDESRRQNATVHNNVRSANSRSPYQNGPLQPYRAGYPSTRYGTTNPFSNSYFGHFQYPPYHPSNYPHYGYGYPPLVHAAPNPFRRITAPPGPSRETAASPPVLPHVNHEVPVPFTSDLIFTVPVQCTYATLHSRFSTSIQQTWPEHTAHSEIGPTSVQKVLNLKRFKRRNGQHSVQMLCCNGPSPDQSSAPIQMRWL